MSAVPSNILLDNPFTAGQVVTGSDEWRMLENSGLAAQVIAYNFQRMAQGPGPVGPSGPAPPSYYESKVNPFQTARLNRPPVPLSSSITSFARSSPTNKAPPRTMFNPRLVQEAEQIGVPMELSTPELARPQTDLEEEEPFGYESGEEETLRPGWGSWLRNTFRI